MHNTIRRRRASVALAVLALSLITTACGGSGAPTAPGSTGASGASGAAGSVAGLTAHYDGVKTTDGAVVVDAASAAHDFKKADADGTLHFASGAAGVKDAKPGSAIVVEGVALRKIVSVSESGGELVVKTSDASLTDLVHDGRLGWTYAVDWNDLPAATYTAAAATGGLTPQLASSSNELPAQIPTVAVAGQTLKFTGTVQGFTVDLKLVPGPGRLDFSMTATRSNVKASAKGFLTSFTHAADFDIEGGDAQLFKSDVTGLKGEAELTWAAFQVADGSLNSTVTGFEIPLSIPIAFSVGPVPMTMSVKMNLRFVPSLTTGKASSGGSFKVTYDSEQGFSTNGKDVTPIGKAVNFLADLGSTETVTAGMGPAGFGFGMEWPRLELALGNPLMADLMKTYAFVTSNFYVNGMWTPGTTLTSDIPPCQRASIKLTAIAGYKLNVLGFGELSDNKLLWEKSLDKYKDGKPCTLTGA